MNELAQGTPTARPRSGRGTSNRILLALPQAVFEHLRPNLKTVNLVRQQVIYHVDTPVKHVYFIDRGLISLVKIMQDGRTVEIEALGIEGVTGTYSLYGIGYARFDVIVQIPGAALRIASSTLRSEVARSEAFQNLMQRYAFFAVTRLAQTAACNRLHPLKERCCRWLLIAHDNARSDSFPFTHEFFAMMLGVQRPGLSVILGNLEKAGLIRWARGHVTIADRSGLEAAACECYGSIRAQLDLLFGS